MNAIDLFDRLPICGCGRPDMIVALLRDYLLSLKHQKEEWDADPPVFPYQIDLAGKRFEPWILTADTADGEILRELIGHIADHAELTEHGGSVLGAWITEDGLKALEIWEERGVDDWAWEPA